MYKRHRRIDIQHGLYGDDGDKDDSSSLETMDNMVNEVSFIAHQTDKVDVSDDPEIAMIGKHFWVSKNPKHIYRMTQIRDIHVRVPYPQVIMYLAWRHLYWVNSDGITLPMHILAHKIIDNLESFSPILQTKIDTHTIVFETLIALSKCKGAIHFCALESMDTSKEYLESNERSKHNLLGDGLGVFFDSDIGRDIYDALFRRRTDIKQSYIEQLIPIHDACFQAMVDKEAIALFKRPGNINSEMST
jgi:hypothetical protein